MTARTLLKLLGDTLDNYNEYNKLLKDHPSILLLSTQLDLLASTTHVLQNIINITEGERIKINAMRQIMIDNESLAKEAAEKTAKTAKEAVEKAAKEAAEKALVSSCNKDTPNTPLIIDPIKHHSVDLTPKILAAYAIAGKTVEKVTNAAPAYYDNSGSFICGSCNHTYAACSICAPKIIATYENNVKEAILMEAVTKSVCNTCAINKTTCALGNGCGLNHYCDNCIPKIPIKPREITSQLTSVTAASVLDAPAVATAPNVANVSTLAKSNNDMAINTPAVFIPTIIAETDTDTIQMANEYVAERGSEYTNYDQCATHIVSAHYHIFKILTYHDGSFHIKQKMHHLTCKSQSGEQLDICIQWCADDYFRLVKCTLYDAVKQEKHCIQAHRVFMYLSGTGYTYKLISSDSTICRITFTIIDGVIVDFRACDHINKTYVL